MVKTIYLCDICKGEYELNELIGVRATGQRTFVLGAPNSSDGTHLCRSCLTALRAQSKEILGDSGYQPKIPDWDARVPTPPSSD